MLAAGPDNWLPQLLQHKAVWGQRSLQKQSRKQGVLGEAVPPESATHVVSIIPVSRYALSLPRGRAGVELEVRNGESLRNGY